MLPDTDIARIVETYHAWRGDGEQQYEDIPGFCKAAALADVRAHGHVLTPGRYVGVEAQEDDGEPFGKKMARLTAALDAQFAESAKLEEEIRTNMHRLGFDRGKEVVR